MAEVHSVPKLEDVAKRAGVSTATVSRCLNEPAKVAKETREKVAEAVAFLGYTPNFAARVMAAKRSFTVGAIIPTMESAIFSQGLQSFQEGLFEKGYTLLVASSAYQPEIERTQIKSLISRGADGLLLIGHERNDALYDFMDRQNVPYLAAWSYRDAARAPSVGFENLDAMAILVTQVIRMGHQNLAMISGVTEGNDRASQRAAGFRMATESAGLEIYEGQIVECHYNIEAGAEAFRQLMEETTRPTAIVCGNDVLAVGAIRGAHSLGLRVPEDVSITGFDDIELARVVQPALTTVHVPHRKMGQLAAERLISLIESGQPTNSVKLDTKVVLRKSLAPKL